MYYVVFQLFKEFLGMTRSFCGSANEPTNLIKQFHLSRILLLRRVLCITRCTKKYPTVIIYWNLFFASDVTFSHIFWIIIIITTLFKIVFVSKYIKFFLSEHQINACIGAFKIDCHRMKMEELVNLIKFQASKWLSKLKSTFLSYFLFSPSSRTDLLHGAREIAEAWAAWYYEKKYKMRILWKN